MVGSLKIAALRQGGVLETRDIPNGRASTAESILRGPQDLHEARFRDAVGRLQVLVLRDLVGQFEADERDLDRHSNHRGWLDEDALVSRALGIYGPNASITSSERALVVGVLEDLRLQRYVDRLDFESEERRAWRLRRQNSEIVEAATHFVDQHRWVPPMIDVNGIIQAVTALNERVRPELPEPRPNVQPQTA